MKTMQEQFQSNLKARFQTNPSLCAAYASRPACTHDMSELLPVLDAADLHNANPIASFHLHLHQ